jgi:hypothetical protein
MVVASVDGRAAVDALSKHAASATRPRGASKVAALDGTPSVALAPVCQA